MAERWARGEAVTLEQLGAAYAAAATADDAAHAAAVKKHPYASVIVGGGVSSSMAARKAAGAPGKAAAASVEDLSAAPVYFDGSTDSVEGRAAAEAAYKDDASAGAAATAAAEAISASSRASAITAIRARVLRQCAAIVRKHFPEPPTTTVPSLSAKAAKAGSASCADLERELVAAARQVRANRRTLEALSRAAVPDEAAVSRASAASVEPVRRASAVAAKMNDSCGAEALRGAIQRNNLWDVFQGE
jgi:hypothetical protein